jgi:hypothetical protein
VNSYRKSEVMLHSATCPRLALKKGSLAFLASVLLVLCKPETLRPSDPRTLGHNVQTQHVQDPQTLRPSDLRPTDPSILGIAPIVLCAKRDVTSINPRGNSRFPHAGMWRSGASRANTRNVRTAASNIPGPMQRYMSTIRSRRLMLWKL